MKDKTDGQQLSWFSSCASASDTASPPQSLNMRSKSVTHCSLASRWWRWLARLWICCGEASCWPGCCRCCGRAVPPWLEGTAQSPEPGWTKRLPGPAATAAHPQARCLGTASCSQPCWWLNKSPQFLFKLPEVAPEGWKKSFEPWWYTETAPSQFREGTKMRLKGGRIE